MAAKSPPDRSSIVVGSEAWYRFGRDFWPGSIASELFKGIKEKDGSGTTFEVKFSMLEIYNEVARDLLEKKTKKGGLKIRQHPKRGFYG